MTPSAHDDKLQKVLAEAYMTKDRLKTGDGWQAETMREIRRLSLSMNRKDMLADLNRFVWRFAATACFITLILSVYVIQTDFQTEYELARLFFDDPVGFDLIQSFDIL